jgi:hypothetical protein
MVNGKWNFLACLKVEEFIWEHGNELSHAIISQTFKSYLTRPVPGEEMATCSTARPAHNSAGASYHYSVTSLTSASYHYSLWPLWRHLPFSLFLTRRSTSLLSTNPAPSVRLCFQKDSRAALAFLSVLLPTRVPPKFPSVLLCNSDVEFQVRICRQDRRRQVGSSRTPVLW